MVLGPGGGHVAVADLAAKDGEMPWKCHGNATEMPWKCQGNDLENARKMLVNMMIYGIMA